MRLATGACALAVVAAAIAACERDPCAGGRARTARTGALVEEWCERDGRRDGYYRARSGEQRITGEFRRGNRVGRWWWLPAELGPPTRFVDYGDDGEVRGEGGFLAGQRHGRWREYLLGHGPDPGRWYEARDVEYRCGRVVGGAEISASGVRTPLPADPPSGVPCP